VSEYLGFFAIDSKDADLQTGSFGGGGRGTRSRLWHSAARKEGQPRSIGAPVGRVRADWPSIATTQIEVLRGGSFF
jgi:hypothetical protein